MHSAGDAIEPGIERGALSPLIDGGETIGAVLRTRRGLRPVFVSVGHRIGLQTAIDLVLRCTTGQFRLPEPIAPLTGCRVTIQALLMVLSDNEHLSSNRRRR